MARVLTLDNVNVEGKTVLVRVDINCPMDPATNTFLDDTRIKAILPTLNQLSKAKVIILAHQSRPGKNDFTSTLGHSRELGRLLGRQIKWVDDIYGSKAMEAIEQLQDGQILMLNNVRMDEQEVSVTGDFTTMSRRKWSKRYQELLIYLLTMLLHVLIAPLLLSPDSLTKYHVLLVN